VQESRGKSPPVTGIPVADEAPLIVDGAAKFNFASPSVSLQQESQTYGAKQYSKKSADHPGGA
jgi:hypothetical protein